MARPMLAASFCRSLTSKLSDLSLLPRNGLFLCRYFTDQPSDVPRKPKKPGSSFMVFYAKMRPVIRKQYPESSMVDTAVKIGELYRQLPEEKKMELKVEADKLLDDYHQQVEEWKSIIGYEGVKQLKNENKKQREIKKKKLQKQTIKKLSEEKNRPKFPGGAYFAFLKDEREKARASGRELAAFTQDRKQNFQFHEVNQKWKQMSAEEKQIYFQRAHVEAEDYHKKMVDWEKDMIEAGMVSLVRKKTLQELNLKTPQEGQVKGNAKKRGNTTKGKAKVKSARTKSMVNVERTGTKDKAKVESTGTKDKAKVESTRTKDKAKVESTGTKGKARSKKNQIESSSSDEDQ